MAVEVFVGASVAVGGGVLLAVAVGVGITTVIVGVFTELLPLASPSSAGPSTERTVTEYVPGASTLISPPHIPSLSTVTV